MKGSQATPVAARRDHWGLDDFGIGLALSGAGTPGVWRHEFELAERADALGLHSLWVPEMHFQTGACAAPVTTLFALAAATTHIRIASTSLLLPIHDPDALARDLAVLDRMSGGRVIVGLGRGFRPALFHAFGVDAKAKRDLFDAALDRMLECWEAEGIAPPLAVAAFGPKGLAQAARRALPYLPSMIETLDTLEDNYQRHEEGLPAGARRSEITVPVLRTTHVAADSAEAARVLEALESSARSQATQRALPKSVARAADAAPLERAIVGTASQVVDQIGRYRERIGLDLLIVASAFGPTGPEERAASLERLVGEVLPQLR